MSSLIGMSRFILLCVLSTATSPAAGAATVHNVLSVVTIGDRASFECESNYRSSSRWKYMSTVASSIGVPIFNGNQVRSDYVDKVNVEWHAETGTSRLSIRSVRPKDAGIYVCVSATTGENQLMAELIVQADHPECFTNASLFDYVLDEGTPVGVGCSVCNYGPVSPSVSCHNDQQQLKAVGNPEQDDGSSCKIHNFLFMATEMAHDSRLACSVVLESHGMLGFNYTWQSESLSVNYGPASAVIEMPNRAAFSYGDTLRCTAYGKPTPRYHWSTKGRYIQTGPVLTIDPSKIVRGLNRVNKTSVESVTCTAVRGSRFSEISVKIKVMRDDSEGLHRVPINIDRSPTAASDASFNNASVIWGLLLVVLSVIRYSS